MSKHKHEGFVSRFEPFALHPRLHRNKGFSLSPLRKQQWIYTGPEASTQTSNPLPKRRAQNGSTQDSEPQLQPPILYLRGEHKANKDYTHLVTTKITNKEFSQNKDPTG